MELVPVLRVHTGNGNSLNLKSSHLSQSIKVVFSHIRPGSPTVDIRVVEPSDSALLVTSGPQTPVRLVYPSGGRHGFFCVFKFFHMTLDVPVDGKSNQIPNPTPYRLLAGQVKVFCSSEFVFSFMTSSLKSFFHV